MIIKNSFYFRYRSYPALGLCDLTLWIRATKIYVASTDEPPYDTNGKVIPTTGTIARHIPIFSTLCTIIIAATPIAICAPISLPHL